jgi:hypothetical protein
LLAVASPEIFTIHKTKFLSAGQKLLYVIEIAFLAGRQLQAGLG